MIPRHRPARAQLHAIVPRLGAEELRHQLRHRLGVLLGAGTDWTSSSDGWLLRGGPFTLLVHDSWDGPELRLGRAATQDAAESVERLLSGRESTATPAATDPTDPTLTDPSLTDPSLTDPTLTDPSLTDPSLTDPPSVTPEPSRSRSARLPAAVRPLAEASGLPPAEVAAFAWRSLLHGWGVPATAWAEIGPPATRPFQAPAPAGSVREALLTPVARHPAARAPEVILDRTAPPALPAGWQLRSWSNPVAGRVQCSVRAQAAGHRLHVESPGLATAEELSALLAAWTAVLTAVAEQPDRPLADLPTPPPVLLGG
ncbi:hypothetical protein ACIGXM_02035 [Kitasatospora sp. NPDC052896]|uniref:hypothetical protein n=1 Tax=Kitasatospora sp. NPDC052896 TaxID=3364061 RepID=UPI0037CB684D